MNMESRNKIYNSAKERVKTYTFLQQLAIYLVSPYVVYCTAFYAIGSDFKNWRDGKAWKTYGRFRYED